jgi:hypothetical protein
MEPPGNELLFPRAPYGHRAVFGYDEIAAIPRNPELSGECPPDPKWAAQRGGQDSPITPTTRSRKLMRDGETHRRLRVPARPVFIARAIRENPVPNRPLTLADLRCAGCRPADLVRP